MPVSNFSEISKFCSTWYHGIPLEHQNKQHHPSVKLVEARVVICFLHLKGPNAKEIHAELVVVHGGKVQGWDICEMMQAILMQLNKP